MTYAAKTEVPIEKTRAEIEATVRRYGADSFVSGWEAERAFVQFRCNGRFVRMTLTLPNRDDAVFTDYKQGSVVFSRKPEQARVRWDQACRQKWRILLLMIKGKLEAIESGIVTFEEEFLAHVVLPDGKTVYERTKEGLALAYATGDGQLFLPGPG